MRSVFLFAVIAVGGACLLGSCRQPEEPETLPAATEADETPGVQIYQAGGTVRSIDKNAGSVSISHGEIKGLMSAMTMTFPVRDRAMLETIAPGDLVNFEIERKGSDLTVTKILKPGTPEPEESPESLEGNANAEAANQ